MDEDSGFECEDGVAAASVEFVWLMAFVTFCPVNWFLSSRETMGMPFMKRTMSMLFSFEGE